MKKSFAKLSKREQEKVEAAYHRMQPKDFDESMSGASQQTPNSVRLPKELVKKLKTVAKRKGESEYQTLVKVWIEERLAREIEAP